MSVTASREIFDALPYFDDDLQKFPHLKAKVDQELAKERVNANEIHPGVPPAITLFTDRPMLKAELERAAAGKPFPALDTLRYALPGPSSVPGSDEEWRAALENADAQLQHQRIRQNNLALLQTYGSNAWRIQNHLLESTAKETDEALEKLKQLSVDVNRERKNTQDKLGRQLTALETRWTELISSVLQIEMANVALEAELARLEQQAAQMS